MRRRVSVICSLLLVLGTLGALPLVLTSAAGAATTAYTPGTPVVDTISSPGTCTATSTATCAPWNASQGDPGTPAYTSNGVGTLLPTYTPGGVQSTTGGVDEPNLAVYPGADSGTDGDAPYPSGTVGTPGPLAGYCGTGTQAQASTGTPQRQPAGTTLPFSPAYFPHIVENADGSLTGYFDERPKDADESIVAATSTDGGKDWTYDSQALEQDPGYCPSADTNDDGEGHPNVVTVGGNTYLYTLERAAGDNTGVGLLVHQLDPTAANPLDGAPAVEETGVDPDDFAGGAVAVPSTGGTPATIALSQPIGSGPEALVAGPFVDLTATPVPSATDVIDCTGVGAQSLTGCTTADPAGLSVAGGDLIEQVLGTVASDHAAAAPATGCSAGSTTPTTTGTGSLPCQVPVGPNTTTGDGGLDGLTLNVTNPDDTDLAIFNANAPNRAYVDGVAVYCSQANAYPTTRIEDCTTGPDGSPLTVNAGDPVTSDPIVPATAQQTTGLVAPDGIVGVLPSYPGAPAGSTVVMYTEKILNYFIAGETTSSSSTKFSTIGTSGTGTLNFFPGSSFPEDLPSTISPSSPVTVDLGDNTLAGATSPSDVFVPVTCTGLTTGSPVTGLATDTLTGCSVPSSIGGTGYSTSDSFKSDSFIAAPGAALVPGTTLAATGEGSTTNAQKLFKNNEDLTIVRVAYTTDGVDFSTTGLANGGIVSGAASGATTATGATDCTTSNEASPSSYSDLSDPCATTSPANLNQYDTAGTALATEMRWIGSGGSIIVNPDGSYGLFLSGAWAGDGDSDAFNQIWYSSSTDGEDWTTPVDVLSTDYTFSASAAQDQALANGQDAPLGISAYYSGRAYGPSVVQNPDGTLTMVFAGYRLPKGDNSAGTVLGTNPGDQYTVGATDPDLYRNILTVTLQSRTSPAVATATAVTSSPAQPVVGQPVTYTATVSVPSPGAGTPTGTVTFTGASDNTLCSGVTLSDTSPDTATCTVTYDSTAGDTVTASYGGDGNYAASESQPYDQAVSSSPTSTTLSVSPGTAVVGQPVTYTATVTPTGGGAGTPTGTVTFSGDGGPLCPAQDLSVVDGSDQATCTATYTSAQTDEVSASYGGDGSFTGSSTTQPQAVTVTEASTTTELTASAAPAVAGQTVTFTATVDPDSPSTATPTGDVTFTLAGPGHPKARCTGGATVALDDGVATCAVTMTLATSPLQVSAAYAGDPGVDAASTAAPVDETVGTAATTVTVTGSEAQAVGGKPLTLTATVAPVSPATGTPTGDVSFAVLSGTGSDVRCTGPSVVALNAGTARCKVAAADVSSRTAPFTVLATYDGSGSYGASSSVPLDVPFEPGAAAVTVTTSGTPTTGVTIAAAVSGVQGPVVPTGTVTFTVDGPGSSPLTCAGGDTRTLSSTGVADCKLAKGELSGVSGRKQLSGTAAYSGDLVYGPAQASFGDLVGG